MADRIARAEALARHAEGKVDEWSRRLQKASAMLARWQRSARRRRASVAKLQVIEALSRPAPKAAPVRRIALED